MFGSIIQFPKRGNLSKEWRGQEFNSKLVNQGLYYNQEIFWMIKECNPEAYVS
jgi:hypothetical protein